MKKKTLLTAGDAAAHCQVSYNTITNWIKGGKLKASMTPGRHHRIHVDDFREFLNEHNWPPFEAESTDRQKILVVDDDPDLVQIITQFFSEMDEYELATASDGFEAGTQVTKFNPDLIMLDLMMPHMDGFKVCRMIKSNPETKHIKLLVITGYVEEENIQKALEYGADYWIEKPFQLAELKKKANELIEGKREKVRDMSQIA